MIKENFVFSSFLALKKDIKGSIPLIFKNVRA